MTNETMKDGERAAFEECAASGDSCSYGPHGHHSEMQCRYCGKARDAARLDAHACRGERVFVVGIGRVAGENRQARDASPRSDERAALPKGWKLVRVNQHFDALIEALEHAESKGYLPDALKEEWASFACDENVDACAAAPQAALTAEQRADLQWAINIAEQHAAYGDVALDRLRLLATAPTERASTASPKSDEKGWQWIERWHGSEPFCGWSIFAGRERIAFIGGDESLSEAVSEIIEAHNRATAPQASHSDDSHSFKNFHRLLCERFDYVHDEKDWRRDQLSLIEHIARQVKAAPQSSSSDEQFEAIDIENHKLRRAMQRVMARLTDLLDEDQFANIESIVAEASVRPPVAHLTHEQREAIKYAAAWMDENISNRYAYTAAKELRALLTQVPTERMSEAEDAARYRWLREGRPGCWSTIMIYSGSALDAAVDAARKAEIERNGQGGEA